MKNKYNTGDKVKIVKYGSLIWVNKNTKEQESSLPLVYEDENFKWLDLHPEVVGQTGVVSEVSLVQGTPQYAIDGIKGKSAWYYEKQMELLKV